MGNSRTVTNLRRSATFAAALWLLLAFVVWNVVFDRIVVLAGRQYVHAAGVAAREGRGYIRIDDWMPPAVAHAIRVATISALAIAVTGMVAVAVAARLDRRRQ